MRFAGALAPTEYAVGAAVKMQLKNRLPSMKIAYEKRIEKTELCSYMVPAHLTVKEV